MIRKVACPHFRLAGQPLKMRGRVSVPTLDRSSGAGRGWEGVMRAMVGVAALALTAFGCTSVKMVQRDGCWVRQTTKWPNQVREELGVCARPEPQWAEDRLSRLVQECMAQADYRWQNRALAAWSRGEPLPPQESEQELLRLCMNEAATSSIAENETLKTRVTELSADREALRASVEDDRSHLRESHDRIAEALGEAAKKPAPAAVATATSNGTATTSNKSDQQSSEPAAQPVAVVAMPGMLTSSVPAGVACELPPKGEVEVKAPASPKVPKARKVRAEKRAAPECAPPAGSGDSAPAPAIVGESVASKPSLEVVPSPGSLPATGGSGGE